VRITKALVTILAAATAASAAEKAVELTVLPSAREVVLGQPLMATVSIRNNSLPPIFVCANWSVLPVAMTDAQRHDIAVHYPAPDEDLFGDMLKPGEQKTFPRALTEIAQIPTPGVYTIRVSLAKAAEASDTFRVVVKLYDAAALNAWADQTMREIFSGPLDGAELAKALASIRGDISEPYLCRLVSESRLLAVPTAVDKLKEIGTTGAARCMIAALPGYQADTGSTAYIAAALRSIGKSNPDPALHKEIDTALAGPGKNAAP
jgi:hypothetical protein